ncbi:TPA: conjugal transfer protein TraF, partial [Escherichia coli]|nr:conjugal transfer protein TraF [Escherichia coli]
MHRGFCVAHEPSILLPSVGAQLSNPDNITDNADRISDEWKAFDRAIESNHGVPEAAARLKEHLRDFRNTHAAAQLGVSAVAALPGDRLSAALMVKSHGTVSVDGKVSDADLTYLEEVANST